MKAFILTIACALLISCATFEKKVGTIKNDPGETLIDVVWLIEFVKDLD